MTASQLYMQRRNHTCDKLGDTVLFYMHICTDCSVEREPITGKSYEDPIKRGDLRARTIQPTERQMTRCEVPMIETFTVQQTKGTNCHKIATQIGTAALELQVDYNGLVVVASKSDG